MDLVKRLRTQPPRLGRSASTDMLRDEAADKIEQLQREVQDRDKVEYALRNDVERLRAALDDIANGRLSVTDAMLVSKEAMQTAIAEYSQERARVALAAR